MSKAMQGVALIGLAAVSAVVPVFLGATGAVLAAFNTAAISIALQGAAMEGQALADSLSGPAAQNGAIRQPEAPREIVIGTQRVGGVMVYANTTGGSHGHYHRVIVLAGHVCHSLLGLYLDGRKVIWGGTGDGYQTRNGVAFGGWADGNDHIGPDGNTYNFGNKLVYAEVRYGDQLPGDVMTSLRTNCPDWAPSAKGSPYLGGCTYIYLQTSIDATMFPNGMYTQVRVDVNGKCDIWDPRSKTKGFTTNWALCVADRMTDSLLGLGMDQSEINEDQLIAAANVSDEQVPLAAGGFEARYALSWHGSTTTAPGDVISSMMTAAAGRMSRIGGQWYLWPAYWQGPSFNFNQDVLLGDKLPWKPYRSLKDRFNRVTGTYTAANHPFNAAGNLYDSNGWYDGTLQNNFEFGFQPTNYPQFAMDVAHGYATDQWLTADGGNPLPREIPMPCTLSVAQTQRVAKIMLMRNRMEGRGSLACSIQAWGMQPTDVMQFTLAKRGWQNKVLEITGTTFHIEERSSKNSSRGLACWVEFEVCETGPEVYEWHPELGDEQTVYAVPAGMQQTPYYVTAPTGLTLVSATSTGNNPGVGGNSTNYALLASWQAPQDPLVTQISIRAKLHTDTAWYSAGTVPVGVSSTYIYGLNKGSSYDVSISALRVNGAMSAWVEVDNFTVTG